MKKLITCCALVLTGCATIKPQPMQTTQISFTVNDGSVTRVDFNRMPKSNVKYEIIIVHVATNTTLGYFHALLLTNQDSITNKLAITILKRFNSRAPFRSTYMPGDTINGIFKTILL